MNYQNLSNLETAQLTYGDNLDQIQTVCNMNTGFRGARILNRTNGVDVGKLDNWIKCLSDRGGELADRPLATYTLPGAHDALTYAFKGWHRRGAKGGTVTQVLDLTSQFNLGIRYFDIRVKEKNGELIGFHGMFNLTGVDIEAAIANLFRIAVQKKEPIVIKFDYKGNAFPIVSRLANMFSGNIMPTSEYWKSSVGECIRQGKVLCLFHKIKSKHKAKLGDVVDMFGDYSKHKAGGFSNKHNMKSHAGYLEKLTTQGYSLDEERLKVMSLNIPCIPTSGSQIAGGAMNTVLAGVPSLLYRGGQRIIRVKTHNRWLGFYKAVSSIEQLEVVKDINLGFVNKLTDLVNSWYSLEDDENNPIARESHGEKMTQYVAGAVGMDFVQGKRDLILQLIELNNRDF